MRIDNPEIERIISEMIVLHPEYKVKKGEPYYRKGYDTYCFSSHQFIEQYRKMHPRDYAQLLLACTHSRIGQDRSAHGQIAACLGRFAKGRTDIKKIGRRALSRDVHGNMVLPMWWIYEVTL